MQQVIERLRKNLTVRGRTDKTISLYTGISSKFLSKHKAINEDTISDYLYELKKGHYSDNYLRLVYYILKRLAKSNNKEIEMGPPAQGKESLIQPVFSLDEVKKIIEGVKDKGDIQQKAIFAVSTIWALRKTEILRITKQDINYKDNTILIKTAKHGRPQLYTIPESVRDYIYDYKWPQVSNFHIYGIFNYALYLSGFDLKNYNHYGFHAIRRALITEMLKAGIDNYTIALWCRWRIPAFGMLPTYTHLVKGDLEEKVYPKHPFLVFW